MQKILRRLSVLVENIDKKSCHGVRLEQPTLSGGAAGHKISSIASIARIAWRSRHNSTAAKAADQGVNNRHGLKPCPYVGIQSSKLICCRRKLQAIL